MDNYIDIEKNPEGDASNLIVAVLEIWNWGKTFNFWSGMKKVTRVHSERKKPERNETESSS